LFLFFQTSGLVALKKFRRHRGAKQKGQTCRGSNTNPPPNPRHETLLSACILFTRVLLGLCSRRHCKGFVFLEYSPEYQHRLAPYLHLLDYRYTLLPRQSVHLRPLGYKSTTVSAATRNQRPLLEHPALARGVFTRSNHGYGGPFGERRHGILNNSMLSKNSMLPCRLRFSRCMLITHVDVRSFFVHSLRRWSF
jgi:hypothetical protein